MEEADALCQRIAIIDHGQIIALGTPAGTEELDPRRLSCCGCVSASIRRTCSQRLQALRRRYAKCEPLDSTRQPMSMPIAAARLIPEIAHRRAAPRRGTFATCTSPNPVWRTCSCTTPEGACAIELENVWRHAGARRPCGAAQPDADRCCKHSCSRCLFVFIFGRVMVEQRL